MRTITQITGLFGLIVLLHASSVSAGLLTAAYESQLETWLGEGDLDFTNLYTKSAQDTSFTFHGAVDGQGRTITLIEARQSSSDPWQIIGGYNPQSWGSFGDYNYTLPDEERTAFIFNLTNALLHRQKLSSDPNGAGAFGTTQTYNVASWGPTFGQGADLGVRTDLSSGHIYSASYGPNPVGGANVLGLFHSTDVQYGALEVYTLAPASAQPVPEPSSLVLLLAGGLIGGVRQYRRRLSRA